LCDLTSASALALLPVAQELLQPDVRQRMFEARVKHGGRARADVGATACGFYNCHGVTYPRYHNLGPEIIVAVNLDDLPDEAHAVGGDVVEPADERTHVG